MIAPDALDLHGVAVQLGVSYSQLQRTWRTIDGFPPPYLGGGKGERPRWARQAVTDFMLGRRWAATEAPPVALSAAKAPANDPVRRPPPDNVAALLFAAGG